MAKKAPQFHERVRTRMHGDYYSSSADEIIISATVEASDEAERRVADIAFLVEKAEIPAYMAEAVLDKADKDELLSIEEARQLITEHEAKESE